jgi:hypothetical protein
MRSRIVFSQLFKKDIPQMVQGLTELHRVDQGAPGDIGAVVPVKVRTGKDKGGDLPAAFPELDAAQIPAHAQVKCTSEDVGGLKAGFCQCPSPPFHLIYLGRYGRKRKRFKGLSPFGTFCRRPSTRPAKVIGLMAFFSDSP